MNKKKVGRPKGSKKAFKLKPIVSYLPKYLIERLEEKAIEKTMSLSETIRRILDEKFEGDI